MNILKTIFSEAGKEFLSYFEVDADAMSPKMKSIMSNPVDRKKYLDAIEKLREKENEEIEITLSNDEKMTITLNP
jgi:hypothetical protein